MAAATFPTQKEPTHRYYADNGAFPLGDALVLRAMIKHAKPRRIIEVGSGFSTACMLDTLDELGRSVRMTCIEPYPDRLKSLLRPGDLVEIIASPVQRVAVDRFAALQSGDILFIDSTHVVKAGSDVHYELFEILPRLAPGVFIHFHDAMYPFEYPLEWIFEHNHSWNEAYMLRAFLMYNKEFSVFYSSSYLMLYARSLLTTHFAGFPSNPGSGLWLLREVPSTSQPTASGP
jgi:predicted O-methyltransferase YrrM